VLKACHLEAQFIVAKLNYSYNEKLFPTLKLQK